MKNWIWKLISSVTLGRNIGLILRTLPPNRHYMKRLRWQPRSMRDKLCYLIHLHIMNRHMCDHANTDPVGPAWSQQLWQPQGTCQKSRPLGSTPGRGPQKHPAVSQAPWVIPTDRSAGEALPCCSLLSKFHKLRWWIFFSSLEAGSLEVPQVWVVLGAPLSLTILHQPEHEQQLLCLAWTPVGSALTTMGDWWGADGEVENIVYSSP